MADRSRASIRFHLASPFQQSSETTPHMLTRLCYRPAARACSFPFALHQLRKPQFPVKISTLPAQTP